MNTLSKFNKPAVVLMDLEKQQKSKSCNFWNVWLVSFSFCNFNYLDFSQFDFSQFELTMNGIERSAEYIIYTRDKKLNWCTWRNNLNVYVDQIGMFQTLNHFFLGSMLDDMLREMSVQISLIIIIEVEPASTLFIF